MVTDEQLAVGLSTAGPHRHLRSGEFGDDVLAAAGWVADWDIRHQYRQRRVPGHRVHPADGGADRTGVRRIDNRLTQIGIR